MDNTNSSNLLVNVNSNDTFIEIEDLNVNITSSSLTFCSIEHETSFNHSKSAIGSECFVDGLSCVPPLLLVVPILCVLKKKYDGTYGWVHFPCHKLRWLLIFLLIIAYITEIAEGFMTNYIESGSHIHLYFPEMLSLFGVVIAISYYHKIEQRNSPRFLLILLFYWIVCIIATLLRLVHLWLSGAPANLAKGILTYIVLLIYLGLLAIEIYVWLKLRYAGFRKSKGRKLKIPSELKNTSYIYSYANLPSQLSFFWVWALLKRGAKLPLELKHLDNLPEKETSSHTYEKLMEVIEAEKDVALKKKKPVRLWRCYLKAYWLNMTTAGIAMLFGNAFRFVGPLALVGLINFVESGPTVSSAIQDRTITIARLFSNGYVLSIAIFISAVCENILLQHHHHLVIREAIRFRTAYQNVIFAKSLKLSSSSLNDEFTAGQVVNLLSVDVSNLVQLFYFFHYTWNIPIIVVVCIYLLYHQLGYSVLLALLALVLILPIQFLLARAFATVQKKILESSDGRIQHLNEMLQGIKVIKMFAWEKLFLSRIIASRKEQIKQLLRGVVLSAFTLFTTEGTPIIITLIAFSAYPYLSGEALTVSRAFSSLALFNLLAFPLVIVPMLANVIVKAHVSNQRLEPFLMAPELDGLDLYKQVSIPRDDPSIPDVIVSPSAIILEPVSFNNSHKEGRMANKNTSNKNPPNNDTANRSGQSCSGSGGRNNNREQSNALETTEEAETEETDCLMSTNPISTNQTSNDGANIMKVEHEFFTPMSTPLYVPMPIPLTAPQNHMMSPNQMSPYQMSPNQSSDDGANILQVEHRLSQEGLTPLPTPLPTPQMMSPNEMSPYQMSPNRMSPNQTNDDGPNILKVEHRLSQEGLTPLPTPLPTPVSTPQFNMSPNQMSPNQMSPNQMSPNQMSPNQMSPNQMSPYQISPIESINDGPNILTVEHRPSREGLTPLPTPQTPGERGNYETDYAPLGYIYTEPPASQPPNILVISHDDHVSYPHTPYVKDPGMKPTALVEPPTEFATCSPLQMSVNVSEEEVPVTEDDDFVAVQVTNGCFCWNDGHSEIDMKTAVKGNDVKQGEEGKKASGLKNINFKAMLGELTIVVGPVGSGKSTLLSSLLAETKCTAGKVRWKKHQKIAYCSQVAWIFNASLQDNILFGEAMDKTKYQRVIHACALQPDIGILPAGDETEIGEKGLNLSGGQNQRISVARALYSNADVFIMDDPFSALDLHVGSHVFEDGIIRFLLRHGKTVILVTHSLHFLPYADMIYCLYAGEISHIGTLLDIKNSDPEMFYQWKIAVKQARMASVFETTNETETEEERRHLLHNIATKEFQRHNTKEHSNTVEEGDTVLSPLSPPECEDVHPEPLHCSLGERRSYEDVLSFFHGRSDRGKGAHKPVSPEHWPMNSCNHLLCPPSHCIRHRVHGNRMKEMQEHMHYKNHRQNGRPLTPINKSTEELPTIVETMDCDEAAAVGGGMTGGGGSKWRLVEDEERDHGAVAWKIYWQYLRACTILLGSLALLLLICKTSAAVVTNVWLAQWSSAADAINSYNSSKTTTNDDDKDLMAIGEKEDTSQYYINIYAVLSAVTLVMTFISAAFGELAGLRASKTLHQNMLHNIVHAPMRFFDTTPVGRILNRFSGDTNTIDEKLPKSMTSLLSTLLVCLCAIIVNTVVTPYFLFAAIPLVVIYFMLQNFFRQSSRELQRMENISKSPVLALLGEMLAGLSTVRAYGHQERFLAMFRWRVDINTSASLWLNTANRWLGIRLDILGAIVVLSACLSSVTAARHGVISSGFVGLAVTYALLICHLLNWVVRKMTETEMQMNAVERMNFYANVMQEPQVKDKTRIVPVPPDWPSAGAVSFDGVSLHYDERLSPVVYKISLDIKPREKVGIVGRTGSGKSSTLLSLLRMVEICEGVVSIDGLDITAVPVETLRSRIAVIPQDPFLFAGSLRHNLDPGGERSDTELWEVLATSQMSEVIEALPGKLDANVSESGSNFSVGQRQLLCLSRALLRRAPLLLMDEATSSIDLATDQIIQELVHTALTDTTVITVAHRVASILDYDRIVVFEEGRIVESGTPRELQKKPNGRFASMLASNK